MIANETIIYTSNANYMKHVNFDCMICIIASMLIVLIFNPLKEITIANDTDNKYI